MSDPESPDTIFHLMYSRFAILLMLLIYDNGCKTLEYYLNREHYFFRNFQPLIDRLHFKNHVGCSNCDSIEAFDYLNPLNTQVAEQGNLIYIPAQKFLLI